MPWTRNLFEKDQLVKMLEAFDELIKEPLSIHICGGAACIISHNFQRTTIDIDVVRSDKDLRKFEKEIQEVARKFGSENNTEIWLNQGPKGVNTHLPADYEERLSTVKGNFKKLNVKSISEPDLMIMKLAIALNTVDGLLRSRDFEDVANLKINEAGKRIVNRELNKITKENSEHGQKMRTLLEGLRPDLTGNRKMADLQPDSLTVIVANVKKEHGLEIKPEIVSIWEKQLARNEVTIEAIQNLINDKVQSRKSQISEPQNDKSRTVLPDDGRSL